MLRWVVPKQIVRHEFVLSSQGTQVRGWGSRTKPGDPQTKAYEASFCQSDRVAWSVKNTSDVLGWAGLSCCRLPPTGRRGGGHLLPGMP